MTLVVMLVDPDTGELVDVSGNPRESGRYRRIARRMLSKDGKNLDYGADGNDTLTISKGGARGREINLLADTVKVPGGFTVNGRTIEEITAAQAIPLLDKIEGTELQIAVDKVVDPVTGDAHDVISLDQDVLGRIMRLEEAVGEQQGDTSSFITKDELARAIESVTIEDDDDLDAVKSQLQALLAQLNEMVSGS